MVVQVFVFVIERSIAVLTNFLQISELRYTYVFVGGEKYLKILKILEQ